MVERLTAKKTTLAMIASGSYVQKEGMEPNHILTSVGKVSRANVIAAVVEKMGRSILLDDGSGKMEARSFENGQLFENIAVGDILLLIGRPREYQGKRYLAAEIAKRLTSPKWLELRKAELESNKTEEKTPPPKETTVSPVKPVVKEEEGELLVGKSEKLLVLIKELDEGTGAPIEQLIEQTGKDAESTLTTLMAEGEIFEIRPGRVKVLE